MLPGLPGHEMLPGNHRSTQKILAFHHKSQRTKNAPVTIERPKSAEIEVKLIGKCGSPAKLPKTEPASTILQWLDACDPLPTIAAKLQQRHCSIIEYYIPLLVPLKTP